MKAAQKFTVPEVTKADNDWSIEELLATIRRSTVIREPKCWRQVPVPEGTKPARLAPAYCIVLLSRKLNAELATGHPVNAIEEKSVRGDVMITPLKTVQKIDGKLEETPIISGCITNDLLTRVSAVEADRMAYLHRVIKGAPQPTFLGDKTKLVTGFETMPHSCESVPTEATEDANMNRIQYYNQFRETERWRNTVRHRLGCSLPANDCRVKTIVTNAGKNFTTLVIHGPPHVAAKKIEDFYRLLSYHRQIRGEDESPMSRLTAGYYIASMTRTQDKLFWQVTDILSAMNHYKSKILFISTPALLKSTLIQMLVLNDIKVVLRGESAMQTVANVTYSWVCPDGAVYYEREMLYSAPQSILKGSKISTMDDDKMKEAAHAWSKRIGTKLRAFRHLYLHPAMAKGFYQIIPSVHAHAGHVIMLNSEHVIKDQDVLYQKMIARAILANKFKTNFPVGRETFVRIDNCAPEFLYKEGLNFPGKKVKQVEKYTDEVIANMGAPAFKLPVPEEFDVKLQVNLEMFDEKEQVAFRVHEQKLKKFYQKKKGQKIGDLQVAVAKFDEKKKKPKDDKGKGHEDSSSSEEDAEPDDGEEEGGEPPDNEEEKSESLEEEGEVFDDVDDQ